MYSKNGNILNKDSKDSILQFVSLFWFLYFFIFEEKKYIYAKELRSLTGFVISFNFSP